MAGKSAVTVELAMLIRELHEGTATRRGLAKRLRALADRLDGSNAAPSAAPKTSGKKSPELDGWREVFGYWRRSTGKLRAKPTPERKKAVVARLRDGYSVRDIKRAIDGCVASDHHRDGNYVDLTLICRNGAKLEQFVDRADDQPALEFGSEVADDAAKAKLEQDAMDALQRGDRARYDAIRKTLERQGA